MREAAGRLAANPLFRLLATAILVAVVVWRSQPQRLASVAAHLGWGSVALAAILTIPFLYLKTLRWLWMLRNVGSQTTFRQAAVSLIGGMGLALLTPARLGEVARVAYLDDGRKLRLSALVMLDKLFDVLVLVLLSSVGAWEVLSPALGLVFLLTGVVGLVFVFAPRLFTPLIERGVQAIPLGGRTREAFSALETLSPESTLSYLLVTVAAFALVIIQFDLILTGTRSVPLNAALLTFPMVILTNIIPVTIAGVGVREGAAMVLLAHFNVPGSVAAVSAFAMFFLNTGLPGVVGAFFPLILRSNRARSVKEPNLGPAGEESDEAIAPMRR